MEFGLKVWLARQAFIVQLSRAWRNIGKKTLTATNNAQNVGNLWLHGVDTNSKTSVCFCLSNC